MTGIGALGDRLRSGTVTSSELVSLALRRAEETAHLNAFVTLDPVGAREAARARDEELAAGTDRGPLHGIPIAIKDNIATAGLRTTCGSRLLADFVPPADATVVTRLRAAGAVIVGKTNMDEFAMGSSSERSAFGPVLNPLDPSRVAGGSSGGSAAAVASGVVPIALGSDTGGSVRQPAAFCGVVGMRPTWGTVSRSGLVAFASSLDQVGPLGVDVESCRLLLAAIAGPDPADATSLSPGARAPSSPLRIGVPVGLRDVLPDAGRLALDRAVALLGGGSPVHVPSIRYGGPAYYVISSAEASSNLARFDGVRYGDRQPGDSLDQMIRATRTRGLGPEVQRRILLGTFALSAGYRAAYYDRACRARSLLRAELLAALDGADLLISLTAPETAFALGAKPDPVAMYRSDLLTIPASLAGIPAISVPLVQDDAVWGVQLMARPGADAVVLAAAARLEQALR